MFLHLPLFPGDVGGGGGGFEMILKYLALIPQMEEQINKGEAFIYNI